MERAAAATGAPELDVQLRYAKAVLAAEETAEPLYANAMSAGAIGWPFYAARAQLAYGALRRTVPLDQALQPAAEHRDEIVFRRRLPALAARLEQFRGFVDHDRHPLARGGALRSHLGG